MLDVIQCDGFGFNPTLVRLRPVGSRIATITVTTFQSHAGSIEASGGTCREHSRSLVSIPRWFD